MAKYLQNGAISERVIQKSIVSYLRWRGYSSYIIQIYNEGAGMRDRARESYAMGIRPGASDLFIMVARKEKHGLFLELKSENGKVSEHQKKFLQDAKEQGYETGVAWSFDEARKIVDAYLEIK